jgi:hypothetical protein
MPDPSRSADYYAAGWTIPSAHLRDAGNNMISYIVDSDEEQQFKDRMALATTPTNAPIPETGGDDAPPMNGGDGLAQA